MRSRDLVFGSGMHLIVVFVQSLSVYLFGCTDVAWLVGLFLFHLNCLRPLFIIAFVA